MVSTNFANIFGLGTTELIIIIVIILLVFGGSQLPKLARNFGNSAKELRKGLDEAKGISRDNDTPRTTDRPTNQSTKG